MLFYTQIKREFSPTTWKRGQTYFRESRVTDVRLDGDQVACKVKGSDELAYDTTIVMARGTILKSKCSCPSHRVQESHCKHVAALSIFVVERGSLLRAGIGEDEDEAEIGKDEALVFHENEIARDDSRLSSLFRRHPMLLNTPFKLRRDRAAGLLHGQDRERKAFSIPVTLVEAQAIQELARVDDGVIALPKTITSEPVIFVRGVFQQKTLQAISIEPAIRYPDPETGATQVTPMNLLSKDRERSGTWKTTQGLLLELTTQFLPMLDSVEGAKILYQGQAALENLARLLTSSHRRQIILHPSIQIEVDPEPLKLVSMTIGGRTEKGRKLTYVFKSKNATFTSDELAELAKTGRLSSQFVWKDNTLYQLETSLTRVAQYANRSGVAAAETPNAAQAPQGFTVLDDDDEHPLHPLAAYRLSLELGVQDFGVDPDWVEYHEWRKLFDKKKTPALPEVDYGFELREYQTNGLSWMWSLYHRGLSALLADDMGLGKTHQVLAFLSSIYRMRGKPRLPSLVVAPTSVVAAWSQKLQKYDTGLKWHVFHGKGRVLPKNDVNLVLTTYGILQRETKLRERDWHLVVLDEAQAIKNATTISARASRALKSRFKITMTGTPVENQAVDLWSIMEFLLPGYLGSLPRFKRLYGSGRENPTREQAEALKRLITPFILRRTKDQVLKELPEKTEEVISCELTPVQKKVYRAYLNSAEASKMRDSIEAGGKIDYAGILALLTRLKQVCDHPRLPDLTSGKVKSVKSLNPEDTGKWEPFDELLNEALGSNLKVVIFTQYLGMMDMIGHVLKTRGVGYTELRGNTSDRQERLRKFAEEADCKVFVCSLLAGGLGIDLTAGSVCIHIDRWWNPAKENQATDRLHRIGQTRGVQVFKLQIPGTVEDRIASIIETKLSLSGALIEESSLGLKAFSRRELLQLLSPID